jgi:hypothetical protein
LFTKDSRLKMGLKSASDMLKAWGAKMAAAGGVLIGAGSAIAAPLAGLLKSAVGRAEHIGDVSDVFGLTAESASKMASAFELAGGSIEELEMALGKLALANSEGKPLDEFFKEQAKAISEIDDATERYQAAAGIFGNKFARTFVDNAGDVLELLDKAPSLTQTALAQAKAFRMEWTRIGIVLQDGMLPVLRVLNPISLRVSEFAKQNVGLLPTITAVSVGVIGAGAALVGFGAVLSAAGVIVGALGTAVGVILSPLGLLTAGLVAGGLAWVAFSQRGGSAIVGFGDQAAIAFGRMKDAWVGVKDSLEAGDWSLTLRLVGAELNLVWLESTANISNTWGKMLGTMREALVAWSFAVRDIFTKATGSLALGMSSILEQIGLAPSGTTKGIFKGNKSELKALREEAVADASKFGIEQTKREAEAQKKVDEARAALLKLRAEAKELNRGVDFGFDLNPALAGAGMAPGSSRGAFNFGNAAQFFGGNSLQEKQLKAIEAVKLEVGKVVVAIMGLPIARIV